MTVTTVDVKQGEPGHQPGPRRCSVADRGLPGDESLPKPVRDLDGRVLRVGSYPDVTALASREKACGVDEVVPHYEAAATHFDHLSDQGELVVKRHRPEVVAM